MDLSLRFFISSILLGMGLAMDAFSVSLANGLGEPDMKPHRMCGVAGLFAFFQALMPLIGWVCIHTVVRYFESFEKMIPWIALALLLLIGGNMLWEGIRGGEEAERSTAGIGILALLVQGIATSIDALSVGFTIAGYSLPSALLAAAIIAAVTFFICLGGILIGRRMGTALSGKAGILGGIILIAIGVEIFLTGIL